MAYDITATIVTYNPKLDLLKEAINSFVTTSLNVKLYLVDNSPYPFEGHECFLANDKIEYIYINGNRGFGAGHNVILRQPSKMGKYHIILNPDISYSSGTIEALKDYMDNNQNIGNIMPKVFYPNGSLQYLCKLLPSPMDWIVRRFIPIKLVQNRIDYKLEMRFTDYESIMNVPYLSGCFMFLRTSVIEEIGDFDEHIFMYGEDTDLNRRIYQKYQTIYYPKVSIIHNHEKGSHKNMKLLIIHIKAAIYYFNKWGWIFDKERRIINKQTIEKYSK